MTARILWPSQATTSINECVVSYKWSQIHPSESHDPLPRNPRLVTTTQALNDFLHMLPAEVYQLVGIARPSNLSLLLSILHSSFKMKTLPACSASRGYSASIVVWKFSKIFNEKKLTKEYFYRWRPCDRFLSSVFTFISISQFPFDPLSFCPIYILLSVTSQVGVTHANLVRLLSVRFTSDFDFRREWRVLILLCKSCVCLKSV
jgi:hypothetical protein